jgi:hypothetical protein
LVEKAAYPLFVSLRPEQEDLDEEAAFFGPKQ